MNIVPDSLTDVKTQPVVPALFTPEQARKHDAVRAFIYDCIWGSRADWDLDAVKGWLISPEDEGGYGLTEMGAEMWEGVLVNFRRRQAVIDLLSYVDDCQADAYHPAVVQAEEALASWDVEYMPTYSEVS